MTPVDRDILVEIGRGDFATMRKLTSAQKAAIRRLSRKRWIKVGDGGVFLSITNPGRAALRQFDYTLVANTK